jgi:hypothetical protein
MLTAHRTNFKAWTVIHAIADKGTYIYKQKRGPARGRKINLTEPCNKTSKDFIENPGRKIELEVKQAWDLMVTKVS